MTRDDLNPKKFKVAPDVDRNLLLLEGILTRIEDEYGEKLTVTSGLRDMKDHLRIYAQKNAALKKAGKPEIKVPMGSKHLYGQAADIADVSGKFWKWCTANLDLMEELGVYFEDRSATPTWVHVQIVPPKSGRRVFLP